MAASPATKHTKIYRYSNPLFPKLHYEKRHHADEILEATKIIFASKVQNSALTESDMTWKVAMAVSYFNIDIAKEFVEIPDTSLTDQEEDSKIFLDCVFEVLDSFPRKN